MQKKRKLNLAFPMIALLGVTLLRIFLIGWVFYSTSEYNKHNENKLNWIDALNLYNLLPPIVLLTEAITYCVFRKRHFQIRYVRWHIWLSLLSSFLLPYGKIVLVIYILPYYLTNGQMYTFLIAWNSYMIYFMWALFIFARLFFILALRTSVAVPAASEKTTESTGYLDEFSNQ